MAMQRISLFQPPLPLMGSQATRTLEQQAAVHLPPGMLMQRAGAASARLALALAPHSTRFWILAGPGNNGGDGLEAARMLHLQGLPVGVTLAGDPQRLPPDAQQALGRARNAGVPIQAALPGPAELRGALLIDALLGIGVGRGRRPSPALEQCLAVLRQHEGPVLSLDLPSGLDADTGTGAPWTVRATATLSLLSLKPGLFTGRGRDWAGEVWWDDLGVPALGTGASPAPDAWLSSDTPTLPRRHDQHKGSFGDVSVVGGAPGMEGAALLAACAAQAAGAGRVYVHLLSEAAAQCLPAHPALMFRPLDLASRPMAWSRHTVVCGCGGGEAIAEALPTVMSTAAQLVIDADGLNAIAADTSLQRQLRRRAAKGWPTVLTPHPLEAARLLGVTSAEVQDDRLRMAQRIAQTFACVVVLKGSGSVITAAQATPHVNLTGNAALASAGTGDVLAGWLGGWWAQSPAGSVDRNEVQGHAQQVARQAVAWHGAAAEPPRSGPLRAETLIERLYERLRSTEA